MASVEKDGLMSALLLKSIQRPIGKIEPDYSNSTIDNIVNNLYAGGYMVNASNYTGGMSLPRVDSRGVLIAFSGSEGFSIQILLCLDNSIFMRLLWALSWNSWTQISAK